MLREKNYYYNIDENSTGKGKGRVEREITEPKQQYHGK